MTNILKMPTHACLLALGLIAFGAKADVATPEIWNLYGQFTSTEQWHPSFSAPYSGENSLPSGNRGANTNDVTLFAGLRLWQGAAAYINPEIDQGFGLGNTLGLAGFSSGEAYKVGANTPYQRLPRAFIRQVINLGGAEETVASGANQLAGMRTHDNITLTVGKFSVTDIFDTNTYAHDPRIDFFNWSIIDAGAFDYAADSWGFTRGAAMEWTQDWWTLRGGVFALSKAPNSTVVDTTFRQRSYVAEFEERHQWRGMNGKVKLLAFVNQGDMANYGDAVQWGAGNGQVPQVAPVRRYQSRPGVSLNMEQALSPTLGAFGRLSWNDGSKEAFDFTEINRSVSGGLSLQGDSWGRHDDTIGAAFAVNGLSKAAQQYFSAGGMGILIGDGQLNYGLEQIFETYYSYALTKGTRLTFDYQHIQNPAYNRDRGPVDILGLRAHVEF